MMRFTSLTNVRPPKDLGCQIICSPTEGQFKVTPDAAKVMGISAGEYLQLVIDGDGVGHAVKGIKGEEGKGSLGAKVASGNIAGGGVLTISAANAWEELDGDTNFNTHYEVSEESSFMYAEQDENGEPTEEERKYFPMILKEKIEKQVRKKKTVETVEGEDVVVENTEIVSAEEEGSPFAEM